MVPLRREPVGVNGVAIEYGGAGLRSPVHRGVKQCGPDAACQDS